MRLVGVSHEFVQRNVTGYATLVILLSQICVSFLTFSIAFDVFHKTPVIFDLIPPTKRTNAPQFFIRSIQVFLAVKSRLMRDNIFKRNTFNKITRMRLHRKLVPVQYREYKYGFNFFIVLTCKPDVNL